MAVLVGQCRPLIDAEAVLFIGHDQRGRGEIHACGQQCLRADDKIQPRRRIRIRQRRPDFALACGCSRACQQFAPDADTGEQRDQLGGVLGSQNTGRRHDRRLPPRPDCHIHRRRRADRLAAADVADQHPVHGGAARHVVPDFGNGTLLRGGQLIRQQGAEPGEGLLADTADRRPADTCAPALHPQSQREAEELIKRKACLGGVQGLEIRRAVDGAQGKGKRTQPLPLPDVLRQRILHPRDRRHRLPDQPGDQFVAQPLGQRVDREQRGQCAPLGVRFKGGVGQREAAPRALHPPEKAEHRPDRKAVRQVILIEKGDLTGSAVVKCPEFQQSHAILQAAPARRGGHGQNDRLPRAGACRLLRPGKADHVAPVLIGARKVEQQVGYGVQSQSGKLLRPLLAHTRQAEQRCRK